MSTITIAIANGALAAASFAGLAIVYSIAHRLDRRPQPIAASN